MSVDGTTIQFNGVTIYGCHTKRFDQEPVYDDSGTDLLYHRFMIRVVGYVHGGGASNLGFLGVVAPSSSGTTFAGGAPDMLSRIRYRLNEPRQSFLMQTGGQTVLQCDPFTDASQRRILTNRDLNNGPKPRVLGVPQLVGANIFRIEWEVEICKLGCGDGETVGNNGSGVLSNRWACTDDFDKQFMTTRTYQGRLRSVTARLAPISFRDFVLPKLQKGMRRERMTFVQTPDGLTLDYTIVDREVHLSAPKPATDFDMQHSEMTGDAMKSFGDCSVSLSGDRSADHRQLIQLAVQIVDVKLGIVGRNLDGPPAADPVFIEQFQVTDIDGTNAHGVQVRARVRRTAIDNRALINLGRPLNFGGEVQIVDYDPKVSKEPDFTKLLPVAAAFSCALQVPCNGDHQFGQNAVSAEPESASTAEFVPDIEFFVGEEIPAEPRDYPSEQHKAAPYSFYQADNTFPTFGGKLQLPIGRSSTTSPGSSQPDQPTCAIVSLFAPTAKRVLRVKAERYDDWPELPKHEDFTDEGGVVFTALDFTAMPGVRDRGPDGAPIYRAEAEYTWAMSRPLRTEEKFFVGILPWDSKSPDDKYAAAKTFGASEQNLDSGSDGPPPGQA